MRTLALVALLVAFSLPAHAQDVSFGSEPDRTLEAHAFFYVAGIKARNHFGLGSDGFRKGEPSLGRDLGYSPFLPGLGVDAKVNLGVFGWVGGELLGVADDDNVAQLERLRRMGAVSLNRGDVVESSVQAIWGRVDYGYEFRVRLFESLDVALSPTIGFGFLDFDADFRRLVPEPTADLGGRITGYIFAPGFRLRVEAFGIFRVGLEGEFGLTHGQLAVAKHYATLWEHYRLFAGVNLYGIDLTAGWRMDAMHLAGDGDYVDLRIDGFYVSLGARF